MGDEGVANHVLGDFPHLMWGLNEMNSTLISIYEMPFSTAPRMNLRLYDKAVTGKAPSNGLRLFRCFCYSTSGNRYSCGGEKVPSLVFMNIHKEEKLMVGRVEERGI
jgi:hypothetical protein